jgi:hypothetical protein
MIRLSCILIVLVLSIILLNLPPAAALTPPPNGTPVPDWVSGWLSWRSPAPSPDNQWEAVVRRGQPVTVQSLQDPTLIYTDSVPFDDYGFFQAWLPDNTSFVAFEADNGCERCPYDRLILFHINTEAGRLDRYVYEPLAERNQAFSNEPVWSSDGEQIAVIVDHKRIVILNRQAEVIDEITPNGPLEANIVDQVLWTSRGWVYVSRNMQDSPQLKSIYLEHGDGLLYSGYDYPRILAANAPYLMISHNTHRTGFHHPGEITILNMDTHEWEETLLRYGDEYPSYTFEVATTQPLVALLDAHHHLWIYDWSELHDMHRDALKFVGWREDLNAFLILWGNDDVKWLDTARPAYNSPDIP